MKKYDVVYAQRYMQNGEEKTKWINCGAIFETGKGFRMKLDTVPIGCDGWFALFEPKNDKPQPQQSVPADDGFAESSIPF